jgi:hypothetical protein
VRLLRANLTSAVCHCGEIGGEGGRFAIEPATAIKPTTNAMREEFFVISLVSCSGNPVYSPRLAETKSRRHRIKRPILGDRSFGNGVV